MCETKYMPQPGDRIVGSWFNKADDTYYDVIAMGQHYMLTVDNNGNELPRSIRGGLGTNDHWVKVTKPTPCPERVWNVYVDGVGGAYLNDTYADRNILPERIGKMYLHVDGTCEFIRTENNK